MLPTRDACFRARTNGPVRYLACKLDHRRSASRVDPWRGGARLTRDVKHILVVDDDDSIREFAAEWLHEEGFIVAKARHGAEALLRVQDHRPDVIVLDLMMPVMDGWAFAEACHRLTRPTAIPTLVVSAAHGLAQAAERLRPFGVRASLAKPFDLEVLSAMVRRLAGRHVAAPWPG
jgi:two-component system, chemotaxis family, chemotaxis protein CheY